MSDTAITPAKVGISPISLLRNPVAEGEFIRLGLNEHTADENPPPGMWSFIKIRRDSIDRVKSRKNMARLDAPLIAENQAAIAKARDKGTRMPAIWVCQEPTGHVILDGNHRDEESKGFEYMNAYLLNFTKDATGANIRRWLTLIIANDLNGLKTTEQIKIRHAVDEIEEHGMSEDDAEKLTGVKKSKIREGRQLLRFNNLFSGVSKAQTLDEKVKRELAQAVEKVTLPVANKLVQAALNNSQVNANQIREFCDQYKGCTSVSEAEAMLDDIPNKFASQIKQKTAGNVVKPTRGKAVLTKQSLVSKVDKLIVTLRLPRAGVPATLTPEEQTKISTLGDLLQDVLKSAKSPKKVLA